MEQPTARKIKPIAVVYALLIIVIAYLILNGILIYVFGMKNSLTLATACGEPS